MISRSCVWAPCWGVELLKNNSVNLKKKVHNHHNHLVACYVLGNVPDSLYELSRAYNKTRKVGALNFPLFQRWRNKGMEYKYIMCSVSLVLGKSRIWIQVVWFKSPVLYGTWIACAPTFGHSCLWFHGTTRVHANRPSAFWVHYFSTLAISQDAFFTLSRILLVH